MEIEVGEYVRTTRGYIRKINTNMQLFELLSKRQGLGKVVKHSENIIDLIEVGDFVNGFEVDEYDYEEGTMLGIPCYTPDGLFSTLECYLPLEEIKIKSILTHEQYESMCYKVED